MGFLVMAKQGLRKIWILKDQMGLICEGRPNRKRERRRREEEEEEEEEKKKKDGGDQASQGMELLTLYMNSIMNHMDFVWDSREGYEFQI